MLTKQEINELPLFYLPKGIKIYIIKTQIECKEAVKRINNSKCSILGFDTETKPAFQKNQKFNTSLIQISNDESIYLFQINLFGLDDSLISILTDPNIAKVGVALADDFKKLNDMKEVQSQNVIDIAHLAKELNIKAQGIRSLAGNLLGFRVSKGAKLSNWDTEELTATQVQYAAIDAYISLKIYQKLINLKEDSKYAKCR